MTSIAIRSNVLHVGRESVRVVKTVNKLDEFLNTKRHRPKTGMAENITNPYVLGFLEDYLAADRAQAQGEHLAGEIYWLYFEAEEEKQREFVAALCRRHKIELPPLDWTPRQRLVIGLYGDQPDLIEDQDGEIDSKGGKRITAAIRRFEERAGLREDRKERNQEILPRKTRDFLQDLYQAAKPAELAILNRLIARRFGKKAIPQESSAA